MNSRSLPREKAYSYELVDGQTIVAAVTLDEFKAYAKITYTADDVSLQAILDSALEFGQRYTKRVFTTTEFKTYRDEFFSKTIELRRSPFQSISANGFQYYNESNVLVDVGSSIYMTTKEKDFSSIALLNNSDWPNDVSEDRPFQNVEITFKAGYGDSANDVPKGLKLAVMQHALKVASNRGDCSDCKCDKTNLPPEAKTQYDSFKIKELRLGF